jgi:hypothetical protein
MVVAATVAPRRPGGTGQVVDVLPGAVGRAQRGEHTVDRAEPAQRPLATGVAARRCPAVEQAVGLRGVLGQVDRAAARVDRGRLVFEAAQGLDRLRVAVGPLVERVHLEDVPVVLAETVLTGAGVDLLAGQPRVPRRLPARAVGRGAGDTDPLPGPATVATDLDDRAATGRGGVVDEAVYVRDGQLGTPRLADLVVGDEHGRAAAAPERAGAVVVARGGLTRLQHGAPGLGDDRVPEPGGQREALRGVGDERPVPQGAAGRGGGGYGLQRVDAADEQHTGADGRGAPDEVAAGRFGHLVLGS